MTQALKPVPSLYSLPCANVFLKSYLSHAKLEAKETIYLSLLAAKDLCIHNTKVRTIILGKGGPSHLLKLLALLHSMEHELQMKIDRSDMRWCPRK